MRQLPSRADQVGSLLRPMALREARQQHVAGALSREALRTIEDRCIREVIQMQEGIGLQAVTDGEYRRAFWHYDFFSPADGVEFVETTAAVQFSGAPAPALSRQRSPTGSTIPPTIWWTTSCLSRTTRVAPKISLPSPTALHYRGGRKAIATAVYPDLEAFFDDLGLAYQKAIAAFARAGCTYLQLDEVYLAYLCDPKQHEELRSRGENPDNLMQTYAQLINLAIAKRPADMMLAMHLCRGNFRSSWIAQGGYEPVADLLFNTIGIDVYFMEYDTERAGGFAPLRFLPRDKWSCWALLRQKRVLSKTKMSPKRRIDEAAQYVPRAARPEPACGFASTEEGNLLTYDEQRAKLALVVEVAHEVWG